MTDRRDERPARDEHTSGDLRATTLDERAALEEIAALRAVLSGLGVTEPQPGVDPDDAEVDAAIARIVALGGARTGAEVDHGTDGEEGAASGVVDLASRRHRRARRRWTATAGVAAAVLVVVGATTLEGRNTPPAVAAGAPPMLDYPVDPGELVVGEGGASAADTLLELADVAAAQQDPEPVGDVQHALSQSWLYSIIGTSVLFEPVVVESWLAPDGSYVAAEWRGGTLGDDGQLRPVDTSPPPTYVDRLPASTFDPDAVADLSLDPAILREQLLASESAVGCTIDPTISSWCLYRAMADLSSRHVVPSAVASAFWTVLAGEPDLTLVGEVTDRLGRRSTAIAMSAGPLERDPTVRVLLVDSATGRLSGREEVTLSSEVLDVTEPTVTEFRYNVTNNWVARVGGPSTGD